MRCAAEDVATCMSASEVAKFAGPVSARLPATMTCGVPPTWNIHASFETGTVVDEPAKDAMPITTSGYRVVGKLLTLSNIRTWLHKQEIVVKGKW